MTTAAAGLLVGSWEVGDALGRGGQATVLSARHATLGRPAAVKLIHRAVWADPSFRVRFRRECDALAHIAHPHIIPVLDAGEAGGSGYLVMRLAGGGTLAELLAAGPREPATALAVLGPIAGAIDAVHRAGHVHRDITPANILLDDDGGPWLGDFGLARAVDATAATGEGLLVGTAAYLAPEVIAGGRAGPEADRYSLAAVAYHALTGRPPFQAPDLAAVLYGHMHGAAPSVGSLRPDLPAALDAVFVRALSRRLARRPATAGVLIAELGDALRSGPPHRGTALLPVVGPPAPAAATQALPRTRTRDRARRVRRWTAGIAVAAAFGAVGATATVAYTDLGALPFVSDAPAAPVRATTVPDALGGAVPATPAALGDLPPGVPYTDALAADLDGLRVVSLPGGAATLAAVAAGLERDDHIVSTLLVDGRGVGIDARKPWSFFTRADHQAALVLREPAGERAILVRGPDGDVDRYMETLAGSAGARILLAG
ncbi:MAG: serine/threonine-protein kinase [Miltoncostaeaceae bacterium]